MLMFSRHILLFVKVALRNNEELVAAYVGEVKQVPVLLESGEVSKPVDAPYAQICGERRKIQSPTEKLRCGAVSS